MGIFNKRMGSKGVRKMKVWIAVEYEPYEGGDVEGVFTSKIKAVEFVYSKMRGEIKVQEYIQDNIMERPTIFLKSDKELMQWKIEEWEI